MAADIYTKSFNNKDSWIKACELVNIMDPANLVDVIQRRAKIFESLKNDQKWHPINKKPQSGNSATHRKWIEGQTQWLASANTVVTSEDVAFVAKLTGKMMVQEPMDTTVHIPVLVDFCTWLKQSQMNAK